MNTNKFYKNWAIKTRQEAAIKLEKQREAWAKLRKAIMELQDTEALRNTVEEVTRATKAKWTKIKATE
jgi:hypothetical protein